MVRFDDPQTNHRDIQLGCGSAFGAYILGSYFVAFIALILGERSAGLLLAPLLIPLYLFAGLFLIGNSELPADPVLLFWAGFTWCTSILACWGLLKSWFLRTFLWWPILLLILNCVIVVYFQSK